MRATLVLSAFQLLSVSVVSAETFPAANGLQRALVAEQPLLKNPVSVSVDVDGTVYVTETARRKEADLDIREFVKFGWVPRDVSHTSIEDKRAFFQQQLDGKNAFSGTSLKDQNKDGKIDVKDLTAISEKIIRITDKDGDGVYDTSNVFAEGFNTEVTGIAAGTLAWRGDVYATIAPDVWKLRDTDGDGKADKRESLAHGFGIHIAYAGHDMHGLILGPDGKLYWSIGDKGTNVTGKDGKKHFAPHEGAVLRCNPDGSGFEIFARGLRNPQEIAFDKYGNLFSVDNDADFKGERERFLHITEGSDTGWRNYYQYRGSDYNPWMAESIWEPTGKHQPAYITPTSGNYSDGPSGFAYNPGAALNAKYADAFFVTEFPKGNLLSFTVKPKGASFEIAQSHTVLSGPMNVGINFGPDGALYAADWAGGYPLKEKGAVWRIDDPKESGSDLRKEVAAMLKAGAKDISTADLVKRLSHPDMRVRTDAQWALAERKAIAELHQVVTSTKSSQLARIHAVWALTQDGRFFEKAFHSLASSEDPELRAQAAKHAGETLKGSDVLLTKMLADESPRVRFHAATAIWKTGDATAIDAVITMLAENDNKDAYLRHAGVLALAASPAEAIAAKTLTHKSPAVRLAAAVAFRRLSSPLAAKLLSDPDPKVVSEAAHAIFDDPMITAAYPALADLIRTNPKATVPAARRSIAANRYLADAESAARLANYAADDSVESSLRIAALEALASWTQASEPNPVDGRHDPLKPAETALAKAAYQPHAAVLLKHRDKAISKAAAAVSKNLGITSDPEEMEKDILNPKADLATRLRGLDSLAASREKADRAALEKILPEVLKDKSAPLRTRAAALLAEMDPAAFTAYAEAALARSTDIPERQQAVRQLAKIKPDALKPLLAKPAEHPTLLIELSEAFPEVKLDPKTASLTGGDAELGEIVFNENLAAQCVACHRVGKEGSEVGPPLTEVGKKGRHHILESLVSPQAKLAPGYGMMSVKMKDGSTLAGALKQEDKKFLSLILPDKKEVVINLAEVDSRTVPISTMPPMGAILTPRQLRDLVEYLSGLN
jgi:putative membrane-bound dehydrogenase-like protein